MALLNPGGKRELYFSVNWALLKARNTALHLVGFGREMGPTKSRGTHQVRTKTAMAPPNVPSSLSK
jgi:hypothetical protein